MCYLMKKLAHVLITDRPVNKPVIKGCDQKRSLDNRFSQSLSLTAPSCLAGKST